jgi:RNA recognition motif-containing protein
VERAQIITDRDTGRSRGFAFVEMPDATQAQAAIAGLNGTSLGGRQLPLQRYLTSHCTQTSFPVREICPVVTPLYPSHELQDIIHLEHFQGQDHLQ